jgi:hypothetical protein
VDDRKRLRDIFVRSRIVLQTLQAVRREETSGKPLGFLKPMQNLADSLELCRGSISFSFPALYDRSGRMEVHR